jgi:ATP-dependent protease ClpP protease subunit
MTTVLKDGKGYVIAAAEEGAATPTLYLYDSLGVDLFGGIAARQVVADLQSLGPVEALDVRVNSPGGDVFEGIAVYNALKRFPAKVTVHIDGIAASIASLIAMAGDKTLIAENAMVMVHRPWTAVMGDAEEMRRVAEHLDKAWSAMLTTYQRRTGRRAATVAQRVADAGGEWWMTAEEAVAEGFAAQLAASAKDEASAPAVAAPRVAEIEAPRVTAAPREGMSRGARQRVLEVLRLGS